MKIKLPASVNFLDPWSPAYPDGSGCPALVEVDGYTFACDFLGKVTLNLVAPLSGSRWASKKASEKAKKDYTLALEMVTDENWRQLSHKLYSE